MAPLKFSKSEAYLQIDADAEAEILDAYADILDFLKVEDIYLKHLPVIFHNLRIPACFTTDIEECIQWFYDTGTYGSKADTSKGRTTRLLLEALTLTTNQNGSYDISEVVDIDKLIVFGNKLIYFRDNFEEIKYAWRLFVESSGNKVSDSDLLQFKLSLKELKEVKSYLQLDDISDAILIDMLGCGSTTTDGKALNYSISLKGPVVGIKNFAEILGQIGHLEK